MIFGARQWWFSFVAAAIGIVLLPVRGEPDDPGQRSARVLLLRNGHVLRGRVSLYGDRYLISLPNGEIRVPQEDVEHVCRSVEEGYYLKSTAIQTGTARDHLRLAQWCLDQRLMDRAAQQLTLAHELDPRHPRIALIARHLEAARRPSEPEVATVSFEQPASGPEQLDAVARELPPGSVETFSRTVQPLLVNNCTARACHGMATTSDFHLLRHPRGQLPPQRVTLRNLESVLRWVDRDDPLGSRLLMAANQPHGRPQRLTWLQDVPYQHLTAWVKQVARRDAVSAEAAVTRATLPETGEPSLAQRSFPPDGSDFPADPGDASRAAASDGNQAYQPRDPFDPEIFNRRHHPTEP